MSEQKALSVLEQTLVDTINSTKEGITQGIDFASKQIPDVIEQLLKWKLVEASVFMVSGVILILTAIYVYRKFLKDSDGAIVVLSIPLALGGIVCFINNILIMFQIIVAPKIYLIEYVSHLVKSAV